MIIKKIPFLVEGAKGIFNFREYHQIGDANPVIVKESSSPVEVVLVRSKDWVCKIPTSERLMYCGIPVNKKDGTETYWLTEDEKGYVRQIKHVVTDTNNVYGAKVTILTEMYYQFQQ